MAYTCPMHPEVRSDKEGRCPKCGMRLIREKLVAGQGVDMKNEPVPEAANYNRLLIIIGLIALGTLVIAVRDMYAGTFAWQSTMTDFMAGFFLVFSGFKLMDLKGFAEGYSTYDLLAKKLFQYGYAYPFIELAFGLAFLASFSLQAVAAIEVAVMAFSGLGVVRGMLKKQRIQCACLGTIIKLPLGTVTLVEDFGMMAIGVVLVLATVFAAL